MDVSQMEEYIESKYISKLHAFLRGERGPTADLSSYQDVLN